MATKIEAFLAEVVKRLNEHGRRLRVLEQRMERVENELTNLEKIVSRGTEELKIKIERVGEKLSNLSTSISQKEKEIEKIWKEMEKLASKEELNEIKSYVEVFNPLKSTFVTREELERMLEDLKK